MISVSGAIFGAENVRGQVIGQFRELMRPALLGAEFTRAHSRCFHESKRHASEGARRTHTIQVPGTRSS